MFQFVLNIYARNIRTPMFVKEILFKFKSHIDTSLLPRDMSSRQKLKREILELPDVIIKWT